MNRSRAVLLAAGSAFALVVSAAPASAAPGDVVWTYVGPGLGRATATVTGPDGTVYVTGRADASDGSAGYYTAALTFDGQLRWSAFVPGPPGGRDAAAAIALDPVRGRVYVTGSVDTAQPAQPLDSDILTVGYDLTTGAEVWRARFASAPDPVGPDDEGRALVVDPDTGQVVVAGSARGTDSSSEAVLVAYSPSGTTEWVRRAPAAPGRFDTFRAVARDSAGNLYALGTSGDSTGQAGRLVSVTRQGDPRWSKRIPQAPGVTVTLAGTVLVDPLRSRVYTTTSANPDYSSFGNGEVRAWNLTGTSAWTRTVPNESAAPPRALLGEQGEVLVTSIEPTLAGDGDPRLSAWSDGGAPLWSVTLARPGGELVTGIALAANDGTAYVTALGDFGQEVYGVATRTSAGTPVFYERIRAVGAARPEAVDLALGVNVRHLYLVGAFDRPLGEQFAVLALER